MICSQSKMCWPWNDCEKETELLLRNKTLSYVRNAGRTRQMHPLNTNIFHRNMEDAWGVAFIGTDCPHLIDKCLQLHIHSTMWWSIAGNGDFKSCRFD